MHQLMLFAMYFHNYCLDSDKQNIADTHRHRDTSNGIQSAVHHTDDNRQHTGTDRCISILRYITSKSMWQNRQTNRQTDKHWPGVDITTYNRQDRI